MDHGESRHQPIEFMEALKAERQKILVFQRELPLSLQLVTEAIESCRKQMGDVVDDDDDDHSGNTRPVLEEFIPLRPSLSSSESEESRHPHQPDAKLIEKKKPEPDWMRSVQLWSQEPEPVPSRDLPLRPVAVNVRKLGGAFHPFEKEKVVPVLPRPAPAASSSVDTVATPTVGGRSTGEKDNSLSRKARRSWSPELHRRFLHALEQLGGSHAATPKQIRELMKVDGLTNDEVKSHLQKYRLHTRRPTPTVQNSSNSTGPHAAQFVLVGGIWMNPPPEYATAAAAAAAAAAVSQPLELKNASLHEMYPPIASTPTELRSPPHHRHNNQSSGSPVTLHSEGRSSQGGSSLADDGATATASPTCSSSQTTTVSPQM